MVRYLEAAGVTFQYRTEVTNVLFEKTDDGRKIAKTIECKVDGKETSIPLTENDLVFVTNGSCTEGTIYGDHTHAPAGSPDKRLLEPVEKYRGTGRILWTSGEVLFGYREDKLGIGYRDDVEPADHRPDPEDLQA